MSPQADVYVGFSPSQYRRLRDGLLISPSTGAAPVTPGTRPLIGVYCGYQNLARIATYEAWLGRKVDYALEFQETAGADSLLSWPDYMRNYYTTAALDGRKMSIGSTLSSRKVTSPPGNYYDRAFSWAQLAAGQYDTVWANLAINLVAAGRGNAIVRGAHEFTNASFAHRVNGGEEAAFVAAWRRWHGIMRANGFTGLFAWNPETGDYPATGVNLDAAWPGSAYVDLLDLDLYDRWYARGATPAAPRTFSEQTAKWNDHLNGNGYRGLKQWRELAVQRGVGMAFSEWGLGDYFNQADGNHGGGDNVVYVNGMADFILDPAYPPGSPGGVFYHAFWEHNPDNGVLPNSPGSPDSARAIPVPNARAAFLNRFGGA